MKRTEEWNNVNTSKTKKGKILQEQIVVVVVVFDAYGVVTGDPPSLRGGGNGNGDGGGSFTSCPLQ